MKVVRAGSQEKVWTDGLPLVIVLVESKPGNFNEDLASTLYTSRSHIAYIFIFTYTI